MTKHDQLVQAVGEFTSVMHQMKATVGAGHLPHQQQIDLEREWRDLGNARDRLMAILHSEEL